MSFGKWLGEIFAKSGEGIIKGIGDTADRFIHTKEEKAEFQLKIKAAEMEFKRLQMQAEEMFMKDRQSARTMYMKDSMLQKVFGIVFLCGYLVLSIGMVFMILGWFKVTQAGQALTTFQASLLSMVFTAMSTKVNTIVDFLFGGSKSNDDSEQRMAQQFVKYTEEENKKVP